MRFPRNYLRVDLTKLFREDSDSSGRSEDGEEIARSREWRPRKENSQNGYHLKKENVDPWGKKFPQVKSLPTQELKSVPFGKFVRDVSNVENKLQAKPSTREKDKEKTYRIQTIGEVYALQKREGKELPTFRGIRESRSRNSLAKRLTLRKINEPLLMGTGYASYKSRSSARSKGWHWGWSNDFANEYNDSCEDDTCATWFPERDHDDPIQVECGLMNSTRASARASAQLHPPDLRNGQSLPTRNVLPHQWNQTTGECPHVHSTHPALLESELEVPPAPPADAATLHSEMYPSLYGGYGFPYEGPFYNPIVAPPPFPYLVAPPYPIGPIFPIVFPYPVPFPVEVKSSTPPKPAPHSDGQQLQMAANGNTFPEANRNLSEPQYLDPEAIPWIPGSTPFTSNMPISVIKKARSPDFYLLQGLEYVSLRESEEKKRERPENEPPKRVGRNAVNGCREISAAEYAGLLVQNMTEETNPLLTKYLNPRNNRLHETRRYVSMPDSWGSQGKRSEEMGSRRQSWSHPGCLVTGSLD